VTCRPHLQVQAMHPGARAPGGVLRALSDGVCHAACHAVRHAETAAIDSLAALTTAAEVMPNSSYSFSAEAEAP